jgi:transposase-like protein
MCDNDWSSPDHPRCREVAQAALTAARTPKTRFTHDQRRANREAALEALASGGIVEEVAPLHSLTVGTLRAYAHRMGMKPQGSYRAVQRARRDEALAALRAGATTQEVSASTGIKPQTLRTWACNAGIKLTRAHNPPQHLSDRQLAIIAYYAAGSTMRQTGVAYGISYERVRQIIAKQEQLTTTAIPRHPPRSGPVVARVTWRCPHCAHERELLPSAHLKRCPSCGLFSDRDYARVEGWIARLRDGESVYSVARSAGIAYQNVLSGGWRYLRTTGRIAEAPQVFAGYSTAWLERRYPIDGRTSR